MLKDFWESEKDAEEPLRRWEKLTLSAHWANWSELRQTFGSADRVGSCIVFDVGNNRYRLIARVNFAMGKVYTLKVMTHAEYDKKDPGNKSRSKWEAECGCHQPPPERKRKR